MASSIYDLGIILTTKKSVPARICGVNGSKGYKRVSLPVGRYQTLELSRDLAYEDDEDHSDGYSYRIYAVDNKNLLFEKRISIWQNDLYEAVEGIF